MIIPTTAAPMAHNRTAPAARSLISRFLSSRSALTKSAVRSIAELTASAANTMAMTITTAVHSPGVMPNSSPKAAD